MNGSQQGNLLIAAPRLRDANFYRAVVLVLEHSDEGAMGLVINHPSAMPVENALSEHANVEGCEMPVYIGGPVENSALFILHNDHSLPTADSELVPGVFMTGSRESFEAVVAAGMESPADCRFRVYCGYAGWGPGQLESELERGDWRITPATGDIVFEEDPYGIWEICSRRLNRAHRILPHETANPEWN